MDAKRIHKNSSIAYYEGLVRKTAASIEPFVEDEFDEICQFLREKVWKALDAFTPSRVRKTSKYSPGEQLERFVFSCILNGKKDVLKKKRRNWSYIEDFLATQLPNGEQEMGGQQSWFEARYLRTDDLFTDLDPETVPIPATFTQQERRVAMMLYDGFKVDEIAGQLDTTRRGVATVVASMQAKMSEWAPTPPLSAEPTLAAA
jgi:Bacterial regulatory proteins, luxR family